MDLGLPHDYVRRDFKTSFEMIRLLEFMSSSRPFELKNTGQSLIYT